MTTEMQLEVFWREIVWPLASCGAQTIKQSLVMTKRKGEIVSVSVLSKVLSLDCHVQKFGIFGIYRWKVATGHNEASL